MDVLTHLVLPYAAALFVLGLHRMPDAGPASRVARYLGLDARAAGAVALVFGLAGAAPDLDSVYSWAKTLPGLWWLQHRGVSHTLLGAPLHGLAIVGVLHVMAIVGPRRFGHLRFRPLFVAAAIVGSLTHLLLDAVTLAGVPLLWPFQGGRVTLGLFHWLVIWLFPIAALFFLTKWWRGWGPRATVRLGAAFVVVLVLLAGIRVASYPWDEGDDTLVFSRNSMFEWSIVRPLDNGTWESYLLRGESRTEYAWYGDTGPRDGAAVDAIARARDTDNYRGFRMGSFGPVVVNVTGDGDGFNVTFMDVVQVSEIRLGHRWTPADPMESWGIAAFRVKGDTVRTLVAGW